AQLAPRTVFTAGMDVFANRISNVVLWRALNVN
ncbi:MAG: hypothetical protein JWM08_2172, partial [Candidatus Angelobacter sp.]|nr:hypothetical protein [Candidatus Angelobacter sp.]